MHPLIRFYAEEPRRVPGKPAMVRDCGMGKNLSVLIWTDPGLGQYYIRLDSGADPT